MKDNLIIVTGVGFKISKKPLKKIKDIFHDDLIKPNIGASIAKVLVENNYNLLILSRSEKKLKMVRNSLEKINTKVDINYMCVDLLKKEEIKKIEPVLKNFRNVGLVHSVGLSAGSYRVKNDNPYLHVDKVPEDLPVKEFEVVVKSLLLLVKFLLPRLKKQKESHIIVVSSMSGIRAFPLGFSHASAKAGLHFATRSLSLELAKFNIFVSEVQPGIVNTGLYDNPVVHKAVEEIAVAFGHNYEGIALPQMPPGSIGEAVLLCLENESHVLSVSMVSKGQWPHLGA